MAIPRDSTPLAATPLACPECREVSQLGTLAALTGVACADSITQAADGSVTPDHNGQFDTFWGSATTIGAHCRACGWEIEDPGWADALLRVPTLEQRLAGVLFWYDHDPDGSYQPALLADAAIDATAEELADPRIQVLAALVPPSLNTTDDTWSGNLIELFAFVADAADTVAGILTEPAH